MEGHFLSVHMNSLRPHVLSKGPRSLDTRIHFWNVPHLLVIQRVPWPFAHGLQTPVGGAGVNADKEDGWMDIQTDG
jgi:hypothetical protein